MECKLIYDPKSIDHKKWGDFVKSHLDANFFQSPQAFQFFNTYSNINPIVIVAVESNKNIVGLLCANILKESNRLKSYFSRRCIVWGGPLAVNMDVAQILINKLSDMVQRKAIYTEFRNLFNNQNLKDAFTNNNYDFEDQLNFIIAVSSIEENKRLLSKSKRRQINQSLKYGAEIIEAENVEQVHMFYKILSALYKSKIRKPLPDFSFFKNFFLQGNLGKYFIIKFKSKIVGGMMSPIFKDTIYEWYVCGEDGLYKNIYPSVLATWAPIEYAAKNNLKYFDFMGAGKPNYNYGVREFKSKFGGKLVNFGRYIRINNPLLYKIGKVGVKIYQ